MLQTSLLRTDHSNLLYSGSLCALLFHFVCKRNHHMTSITLNEYWSVSYFQFCFQKFTTCLKVIPYLRSWYLFTGCITLFWNIVICTWRIRWNPRGYSCWVSPRNCHQIPCLLIAAQPRSHSRLDGTIYKIQLHKIFEYYKEAKQGRG